MLRDHKEPDAKIILREMLQQQFLVTDAGKISIYDLLTDAKASPIKESLYEFLKSKYETETSTFFETLKTAVTQDNRLAADNLKKILSDFIKVNAPHELNVSTELRNKVLKEDEKDALSIKSFESIIREVTNLLKTNLTTSGSGSTENIRGKTVTLINTIYHDASVTKKPISPRAMPADNKTPSKPSSPPPSPKNSTRDFKVELNAIESMLKDAKLNYGSTLDSSIILSKMQSLFAATNPSEFTVVFKQSQNLISSIMAANPANQKNALEAFAHDPNATLTTFMHLQSKKADEKLLSSPFLFDTEKALSKLGIKGENAINAIKKLKNNVLCAALGQNNVKQIRATEIFELLNRTVSFMGAYEPKEKKANIDKLSAIAFVAGQLEKMSNDSHMTDPEKLKKQLIDTLNAARQIAGKYKRDTFFKAIGSALNETMLSMGDVVNDADKIKPMDAAGNSIAWQDEGAKLKSAFKTGSVIVADPKKEERQTTLASAQKKAVVAVAPTVPAQPVTTMKLSK